MLAGEVVCGHREPSIDMKDCGISCLSLPKKEGGHWGGSGAEA